MSQKTLKKWSIEALELYLIDLRKKKENLRKEIGQVKVAIKNKGFEVKV